MNVTKKNICIWYIRPDETNYSIGTIDKQTWDYSIQEVTRYTHNFTITNRQARHVGLKANLSEERPFQVIHLAMSSENRILNRYDQYDA